MDNTKLAVILGYFALVALSLAGGTLVLIFRPEQFAAAGAFLGATLAGATGAAVTIYMLGAQTKKIEEVKVLSNGTLTALREENTRLNAQLLAVVGSAPSAGD